MECFSEHAIGHKDADVREGVKELALQASKIIGVRIEGYLNAMSERHRRAVMNAATAASETMAHASDGNAQYPEPLLSRGRGRGRSRDRSRAE